MRVQLMLIPLLACAAPVAAQAPAQPQPAPRPQPDIQRVLNDPAMADRLANVLQVLSKSFLDLPVGGVQAALEGRQPTAAERKLTVRDVGRRDDPDFERDLQRHIAQSGPIMRHSMKALSEALPAMMKSMEEAGKALERASASMPDPTYPKR